MISVTIRAFAKFRELFGAETELEVVPGCSVYNALAAFAAKYPASETVLFDAGELKPHIVLMYNRERIDFEDAKEIVLQDGDEVVIYPPVSGG